MTTTYETTEDIYARANETLGLDWDTMEIAPEDRVEVSEWDMPVEDVDSMSVSDEDWNAFLEMTFVDPAERVL